MLVEKNKVFNILRCPKSGTPLHKISDDCLISEQSDKFTYKIINGYPILIDYDKSVLNESQIITLNSIIPRKKYNGILKPIKKIVSPRNKISINNVKNFINLLSTSDKKLQILVIGGATIRQGMKPLYDNQHIELYAFDIYATKNVQFIADAHNIPLPSESFDGIIIQAVLEHVIEPQIVVSEIYRLLKEDGLVYAETPFLQHVHEGAFDFTRFTDSGHRYLFKNFKIIKSGVCASAGTQLLWSIDYFFRSLFRSKKIGKFIKLLFFWLQYIDLLIPESYGIDAASGLYILGSKQKTPLNKKEIIKYYHGIQ